MVAVAGAASESESLVVRMGVSVDPVAQRGLRGACELHESTDLRRLPRPSSLIWEGFLAVPANVDRVPLFSNGGEP